MSIEAFVRKKFAAPEWATFFEVGNATGTGCHRHADAVAVNLWPSRGRIIVGMEFKRSRSDWLREMRNPAKAEAVFKYCDRWYLVVDDPKIVKAGELPVHWGLFVVDGNNLHETPAGQLEPVPPGKDFLCALLRCAASAQASTAELAAEHSRGYQSGHEAGKLQNERDGAWKIQEFDRITKNVEAFKAASGIDLAGYNGDEIGELVRLLGKITSGDGASSKFNALDVELDRVLENVAVVREAVAGMRGALRIPPRGSPIVSDASNGQEARDGRRRPRR